MSEDVTAPDTDLSTALIYDNWCPLCLGELDTGWECNKCGYDARWHIIDCERYS